MAFGVGRGNTARDVTLRAELGSQTAVGALAAGTRPAWETAYTLVAHCAIFASGGFAFARIGMLTLLRWLLRAAHRSRRLRDIFFEAWPARLIVQSWSAERYVLDTRDQILARQLYRDGEFDFDKFIAALTLIRDAGLRQPETLVDVGANVGSIAIPALARGLVARCVAIEPEPGNFELLCVNVRLNGLSDRVDLHNAAAGDASAMLRMRLSPDNHGDHRVMSAPAVSTDGGAPPVTVDVAQVRLDDLARAGEAWSAPLLWIDVQGFEARVLAGAASLLEAGTPLVIEFWPAAMAPQGGLDALISALEIYPSASFADLGASSPVLRPLSPKAIRDVYETLDSSGRSTDLLVLPARSA